MNTKKITDPTLESQIKTDADTLWTFAKRYVWKNFPFTETETRIIKRKIILLLQETLPDLYMANRHELICEYCIRMLLTAEYLQRDSSRYITHPVIWFDLCNPYGFMGTKKWYIRHLENNAYENIHFHYTGNGIQVKVNEVESEIFVL
jgi:hypothetical protein